MTRIRTSTLAAALVLSGALQASGAPISLSFDTVILSGNYQLAVDLIDGDGVANTITTLDLFDFGGGAALGAPSTVGGAGGTLASVVTLNDSSFFNSFVQAFTAGMTLGFRVDVATTASGVPQPDSLQISILNALGQPIATTDPSGLDALFFAELSPAGVSSETFALTAPEPMTWLMMTTGVGLLLRRRGSRASARRLRATE
jgi:hypothetical protein